MAADTRSRMISAAIGLLQRRGLAAMSFTDVLAESGAARGAIYHHFPGGKQQLALEAARRNAEDVRGHLHELPAHLPREVVEAFLGTVRPVVQASAGAAAARSRRSPPAAVRPLPIRAACALSRPKRSPAGLASSPENSPRPE